MSLSVKLSFASPILLFRRRTYIGGFETMRSETVAILAKGTGHQSYVFIFSACHQTRVLIIVHHYHFGAFGYVLRRRALESMYCPPLRRLWVTGILSVADCWVTPPPKQRTHKLPGHFWQSELLPGNLKSYAAILSLSTHKSLSGTINCVAPHMKQTRTFGNTKTFRSARLSESRK